MLRKKENAIQTPGLLTFLKEVVKVPELTSNFVQLLNSIIGSITKTTKKNKHQSKIWIYTPEKRVNEWTQPYNTHKHNNKNNQDRNVSKLVVFLLFDQLHYRSWYMV